MCGIAGGWWEERRAAGRDVRNALSKMHHRGPDDSGHELIDFERGTIGLAQTRLSIIDLSSGGHQPMHSRDGRWTIIFNGEIYNYRELRTQLASIGHSFQTDSDTEVLLTAWSHWGSTCLDKLTGMFAFAICDRREQTITCVRDAFGIKPFYYSRTDGGMKFASEIPAILTLLPGKPRLNLQRTYDYLVHGDYDSNEQSFFNDIFHLLPGHLVEFNIASGILGQPKRWWSPKIVENRKVSFTEATKLVRESFLDSISLHLRSDVPLGAALSGGVDSSAVVCALRHLRPSTPIHTFSFIAAESDVNEEHWVDRINSHVGAIPHKVCATSCELVADLDDMITAQGEPFGSTSIYAQYRVFKLAQAHGITVTLDGQGADEMLAGYQGYPGQRILSLLETGHLYAAWSFLNKWAKWPGRSRTEGLKRFLAQATSGSLYTSLRSLNGDEHRPSWLVESFLREQGVSLTYPEVAPDISVRGRRVMSELASSLTTRGVNALLRHGDRNSMRFSIESRVPFLTTDFADLLLSMPEHYLISPEGETKHVFRAALRGIVPDDVLDRKDKIGFATPERDWLLGMSSTVRNWLAEPVDLPFIDQEQMLIEFDQIICGTRPFTQKIWRWINFLRWCQLFKLS